MKKIKVNKKEAKYFKDIEPFKNVKITVKTKPLDSLRKIIN